VSRSDWPCVRLPDADEARTGQTFLGADESLLPAVRFFAAQAAAPGVVAPLIEGDDLHAGGYVSIGRVLTAVGHGVTQGVQGERGVLWNLHRPLCRLGGRRRLVLDHHRRGDRIAVAVVLIDDDGLQEESDAVAFLMVALLHHLGEPRAVLVDDMHRGIDGPKQRPMPAHAFLAVDRLVVRQGDDAG